MSLLDLQPKYSTVPRQTQIPFTVNPVGLLASVNGVFVNWQNEQNADVLPGGILIDIATGLNGFGVSGATSTQSIASGDGYVEFVAAVPLAAGFNTPRAFFAGLTSNSTVTDQAHVQFALQVSSGGVEVWEGGVFKGGFRAARNNGVYRIAIEDGQVVYRADGDLIYRSDQQVTYPVRLGAIFYHRQQDRIGGLVQPPMSPISFSAKYPDGSPVPASYWSAGTFTAPDTRGRYLITAVSETNVFDTAFVDVLRVFPGQDVMPCPTQFIELLGLDDWRVNEQINDDLSAVYTLASENKIRRWRLTWNKLPRVKAELLDAFFEDHRGKAHPFYFYDYRTTVIYNNVRFTRYEKDHKFIHYQKRVVELTYRPK